MTQDGLQFKPSPPIDLWTVTVTKHDGVTDMVGMLDYHLHYALMATEDRVRDTLRRGRGSDQPIRPHRFGRTRRDRRAK